MADWIEDWPEEDDDELDEGLDACMRIGFTWVFRARDAVSNARRRRPGHEKRAPVESDVETGDRPVE